MFTKRVRLVVFLGSAVILLLAALVVAGSEDVPRNIKIALLVLGLAGLAEPLRILYDTLFPSDTDADNLTPDQRNRRDLIAAVQSQWIEGVLYDALRDVRLDIPLDTAPDHAGQSAKYRDYRLTQPTPADTPAPSFFGRIGLILRRENVQDQQTPNTPQNIYNIFRDNDEKLLILGEPASGKTVLMLQLTEQLLTEVTPTNTARIPMVFNLSSWAADPNQTLVEWLIERLRIDYGAPKKLGQQLVGGNSITYMLDGLDEVAEAHRAACLEAINAFTSPDTRLVVCSRVKEYDALSDRLDTHNALILQPLPEEVFKSYLTDNGLPPTTADALLAELTTTDDIWQEARKPLFANILIDTYADRTYIPPPTNTDADAVERVFELAVAPYVTRQLDGKTDKPFADDRTRHSLAWVGWQMNEREMKTFYGEALQVYWLHRQRTRRSLRVFFVLIVVLSVGLIVGLFFGLTFGLVGGLSVGLISGLVGGLFFGLSKVFDIEWQISFRIDRDKLIGGLSDIDIEKQISFRIDRTGLIFGLSVGLIFGLFFGLLGGLSVELFFGLSGELIFGLSGELIFGLSGGLIVGLLVGLRGSTSVSNRSQLNQGLRDTLIFGLSAGLLFGLLFGLLGGLLGGLIGGLIGGLSVGLIVGLLFELLGGLLFELSDVLKHLMLRGILGATQQFPFNLTGFLHYAVKLNLMRQVGGGVMFKHRYFQDYFAAEYEKHYLAQDRGD